VNELPVNAPNPSDWHHGCCRPVGEKRELARRRTSMSAQENMALARRFMEARRPRFAAARSITCIGKCRWTRS
jgi:hypothetical protein